MYLTSNREQRVAPGFTDAFTHLRTSVPCGDQIGMRKMAEAFNTHVYW